MDTSSIATKQIVTNSCKHLSQIYTTVMHVPERIQAICWLQFGSWIGWFPILFYGSGLLHPIALLGPVANYLFLRFVGGTQKTETSQRRRNSTSNPQKFAQFEEYSEEKNSFWPSTKEVQNPWLWTVIGGGVAGVAIEHVLREFL